MYVGEPSRPLGAICIPHQLIPFFFFLISDKCWLIFLFLGSAREPWKVGCHVGVFPGFVLRKIQTQPTPHSPVELGAKWQLVCTRTLTTETLPEFFNVIKYPNHSVLVIYKSCHCSGLPLSAGVVPLSTRSPSSILSNAFSTCTSQLLNATITHSNAPTR